MHGITYQHFNILIFIALVTSNLTMEWGLFLTASGSWQVLPLHVFVILRVVSFFP
jgi:hypothetical protein